MRILFSASPLSGHVRTILPLTLAARAAGHEVVVATGADAVPLPALHGLRTWTVGPAGTGLAGLGTAAQRSAFFAASAARRAEELVPRAAAWAPDLVVSETSEVTGAVVAAVTGARHVIHGLGVMPPMSLWNAYAVHVDGLLARWGEPGTAEAIRDATYLDVCPPVLRRPAEPIWTNALDLRPSLVGEGPAPGGVAALPYRDTVLVEPATGAEARAALAALREARVNVLLRADPADHGPQPPHVLVAADLPHAAVLPHCAALISPGGPSLALSALAHGLPQLVLSVEDAAGEPAVTHGGAALTAGAQTPAAVERAVRQALPRLIEDPDLAAAAAWAQVEIAAMSSPAAIMARIAAKETVSAT